MQARLKVLLVDDQEEEYALLRETLKSFPLELKWADSLESAFRTLKEWPADALLLDLNLKTTKGVDTVHALRAIDQSSPVVVLSQSEELETAREALLADAQVYLVKGEPGWVISRAVEDAIERHRHQSALRDALTSSRNGVILSTEQGRTLFVNEAAVHLLGEALHSTPLTPGLHRMELEKDVEVSCSRLQWNGQPALLTTIRERLAQVHLHRDMTGLVQVQRTETLGRMARGIAADLHLALKDIAELADRSPPDDGTSTSIYRRARDAQKLSGQLLSLALGEPALECLELSQLVDRTVFALRKSLPKTIEMTTRFTTRLTTVEVDRNKLAQLLINLIINAQEALPEGGRIVVEVETAAESRQVCLSVSDSGSGVPAELKARIFDPFFTTRPGSLGLGLATARGIAAEHGGSLKLETSRPEGARFCLRLPLREASTLTPGRPARLTLPRLKGRVLVVDDEPLVLANVSQLLRRCGMDVITFATPTEAIAYFRRENQVELLVLDLMMPEMSGVECLEEIRKLAPQVRVLLSSGFYDIDPEELKPHGVLFKPYSGEELAAAVARVLAQS